MDIASLSLSIYLALIPSILLCLYVYRKDVIEKEPLHLLFVLFFLGVLITIPASFFEKTIMSITRLDIENYFDSYILYSFVVSFGIIAIIEEGFKFIILLSASWKNKNFDFKYDAIVYSVFISLGFATLENILYVQKAGVGVAIWRGAISVPAHAFYAIASGFFYGLAKENSINKNKGKTILYLFLAFIVPVLLHGIFDFLLFTENDILLGIFFSFIAFLYIISYYEIKKTHKESRMKKIN